VMFRSERARSLELVELDVEPYEIAAFARNDQYVAFVGIDRRLEANVGEIRDDQDVHHAPSLIRRVTRQRAPDRPSHGATRTVGSDDVSRTNRFDFAFVTGIDPFQLRGDRMCVAVLGDGNVDRQVQEAT